ncbi:ClpP/crotonase [Rhizodiscina lignyota]|uniref:ClpP/crotonase n=1 Tax=Rhizodiscina lignyota TaxID=1504668 RepID=A0A9P4IAF7_9PEZI|nr:ClpP/crotonase [Rhizodiscina lignyota]
MSSRHLFTVPIPNTSGSFRCTSPADRIYLITFTSPPDNRLTSAFVDTFLLSLDIIEEKYPRGVVVTTSGIQKFYSNGLDLEHSRSTPNFFENKMVKIFDRLLTYPMPTVALMNGHTFAGGFFISIFHDYRIMNPSRGFCCLNEIDIGIAIPPTVLSMFQAKIPLSTTYRSTVLEGKRFPGPEALKEGLVDGLGGLEDAIKFVQERKLVAKAQAGRGAWGQMREDTYRETLSLLRDPTGIAARRTKLDEIKEQEEERRSQRVAEWERKANASKL